MVRQNFDYLDKKYNLYHAEKVVLSGASAGGIGAWQWSNYLKGKIQSSNPYVLDVIVDSGLFVNFTNYQDKTYTTDLLAQNQFKLAHIDETFPLNACVSKYASNPYQCLYLDKAFSSIETRTLFLNSDYDS